VSIAIIRTVKTSGSGNIECKSSGPKVLTVVPRAYAGRLIDLDTTLPGPSRRFEPVRYIDEHDVGKDLQSRERTLLATQL